MIQYMTEEAIKTYQNFDYKPFELRWLRFHVNMGELHAVTKQHLNIFKHYLYKAKVYIVTICVQAYVGVVWCRLLFPHPSACANNIHRYP